ncbi:tetratricopeptide repeat protein [Melittangium boletus]|uniref:tetratricopeptide repeat protein n=1 Tax=Melittangium boletus TaxID=83453 RepID=UPI003DA4F716
MDDTLTEAAEDVERHRALVRGNPDADGLRRLATSLANLGRTLYALDRREEALPVFQDAVDVLRSLVPLNPTGLQSGIVWLTFSHLVDALLARGQYEDALKWAAGAVELWWAMAQSLRHGRVDDDMTMDLFVNLARLGIQLPHTVLKHLGGHAGPLAGRDSAALLLGLAGQLNQLASWSTLGGELEVAPAAWKEMHLFWYSESAVSNEEGSAAWFAILLFLAALQPGPAEPLGQLGSLWNTFGARYLEPLAGEAVELWRALARRNPEAFHPGLADSFTHLSRVLDHLGRHEEALASAQGAVELRRELARRDPEAFLPGLASSLATLGHRLHGTRRHDDALTAAREAVDLYRALAQRDPDTFQPGLALSLRGLGDRWEDSKHPESREQALTATREAVDLYRALVRRDPDAFVHHLADSLLVLGHRSYETARYEEALQATGEAVELRRVFRAHRDPNVFLSDLASSLRVLGDRASRQGRHEAALKATQEAVDLCRTRTQLHPHGHGPGLALASSLNDLVHRLRVLGRHAEALKTAAEAIARCRALTPPIEPNNSAHDHDIKASLPVVGRSLETLEALLMDLATPQAVELPWALAPHGSAELLSTLAGQLNDLAEGLYKAAALPRLAKDLNTASVVDSVASAAWMAVRLFLAALPLGPAGGLGRLGSLSNALGRHPEGPAVRGAVEHWRALTQRHPEAFNHGLADSFGVLNASLFARGQREESLPLARAAVELLRELARRDPEAVLPGLASSLDVLGHRLHGTRRHEEALTATSEAVALYRALAGSAPDAFRPSLASILQRQGDTLKGLERHEEARPVLEEAVNLYQQLVAHVPGEYQPDLAASLHSLGVTLRGLERHEEALAAAQEAVNLRRELARYDPGQYMPLLADSLELQWNTLLEQKRCEEALPAAVEAVALHRALARQNPERIPSDLAVSLSSLSSTLGGMERLEEALAPAHEAIDILWPHLEHHPEYAAVMALLLSAPRILYSALERPLPAELQERGATLERLQKQARALAS